jgi:hypothetical protein
MTNLIPTARPAAVERFMETLIISSQTGRASAVEPPDGIPGKSKLCVVKVSSMRDMMRDGRDAATVSHMI